MCVDWKLNNKLSKNLPKFRAMDALCVNDPNLSHYLQKQIGI